MNQKFAPIFNIEWADKTDWRKLQCQKIGLIEFVDGIKPDEQTQEMVNGLVNFLDTIQDWAVDTYGLPEEVVFDK